MRTTTFRGLHLDAYEHCVRTLLHLAVADADQMLALRNSRAAVVMQSALDEMQDPRDVVPTNHTVDGHLRATIDLLESALVLSKQVGDRSTAPQRRAIRRALKELAEILH